MRPITVSRTGVGVTTVIPTDIYCPSPAKGVTVDVMGDATYSVEITMDDIFDPAVTPLWMAVSNTNLVAGTTDQQGFIEIPCRAIRLNQTAGLGSSRLTLITQSIA